MSIGNIQNLGMSRMLQAAYSSSPLSFPVDRSQYIYARFKNISSVPAMGNASGVSLSRLRVIDTLVGSIKGGSSIIDSEQLSNMNDSQLNAMINKLAEQVHRKASTPAAVPGYTSRVQTAMVFDILA